MTTTAGGVGRWCGVELLTRSDGSSPDAGKELGDGIRDNELNLLPPLGIPSSFGKTLNSFKHLAVVAVVTAAKKAADGGKYILFLTSYET